MVRNAAIGSCLVAVNAFTVVDGASQTPTFNPRRRREIELTVASQVFLWLEDQESRDEAAAAVAAERLREVYELRNVGDGGVVRRLVGDGPGVAAHGRWAGSSKPGEPDEWEFDEGEGEGRLHAAGGLHYAEYLAAASSAARTTGTVASPRKAAAPLVGQSGGGEEAEENTNRGHDWGGSGSCGDGGGGSQMGGGDNTAAPATPGPAAAAAAVPAEGEVDEPSVLLEQRHLSLRLRMQLSRLQALARAPKPKAPPKFTGSLLSRFSRVSAANAAVSGGQPASAAAGHPSSLPGAGRAVVAGPRRLPEGFAEATTALAEEVRLARHEIPPFGVVPPAAVARAQALLGRLEAQAGATAAVVLQAAARSWAARALLFEHVFAAIALQKTFRGFMLRRHLDDAVTAGLLASGAPIDLAALLAPGGFPTSALYAAGTAHQRVGFRAPGEALGPDHGGGYGGGGYALAASPYGGAHRAVSLNIDAMLHAARTDNDRPLSPRLAAPDPGSPASPSGQGHEKWAPSLTPSRLGGGLGSGLVGGVGLSGGGGRVAFDAD